MSGTTERPTNLDIDSGLQRDEVVAQHDPSWVRGGTDVGELTQTNQQVAQTLADLAHRQRLAGPGFDEVQGRWVPDLLAAAKQPHLDHRPPDKIGDLGGAGR